MSVAQQEGSLDEMANAGQLVRGEDGRDAGFRRLVHGAGDGRDAFSRRGVVDEHDVACARPCIASARRRGGRPQPRALAVLDGSRVDAAEAGEALEQRRRSGAPSAEDGDALALVHFETRGAQHPDPRRAAGDAGSVALPKGMGAEGERHD